MHEPTPADVASFCEFTGAAAHIAKDFLKKYQTTDAAVSQYFENNGVLPRESADAWDEGAFHAERNPQYGPENRPGIDFIVEHADALSPAVFQPTLSRPPSRVSTYAGGDAEDDIQASTSASWGQKSGVQETGIVGGSGGHFKKAEQEYYDTQNWAMTIPIFSEREYTQNPEPKFRARELGAPAFLKPVPGGHYLPALLTILQEVPMAKEALLAREIQLPDYGASTEWWDGNPIQSSKVVLVDNPATEPENIDLIFETQRLMAFLEQSERAYGSVQNLLQIEAIGDGKGRPAADFLKAWQDSMIQIRPEDPLSDIFTSLAVNDPEEAAKGQPPTAKLTEFHIPVTQQVIELGGTLYDALDEMVWPEDDNDAVPSIHVKVGEILVARITNNSEESSSGIGLEVPSTFYPDRYLEESMIAVRKMRSERVSLLTQINETNEIQAKLSLVTHPVNIVNQISGIAVLDQARSYFATTPEKSSAVRPKDGDEMLVDIESDDRDFTYEAVANELQLLLQNIALKHRLLEQSKELAMERVRNVTKAYREPETHPEGASLHRYTLRGVSTDPSIIYILANPNTTEDLLDTVTEDWQWWKTSYHQNADQPVQCLKVEQEDVLAAAKNDSSEVLLVYASDKAVAYPRKPIPARLRNFIRADNLAFGRELDQASHLSTPTKRKASEMNEDWGSGWNDEDRPTPVNITVSDDEEMGEPPSYDATVGDEAPSLGLSFGHGENTGFENTGDQTLTKFPDYEDVEVRQDPTGHLDKVANPVDGKGESGIGEGAIDIIPLDPPSSSVTGNNNHTATDKMISPGSH